MVATAPAPTRVPIGTASGDSAGNGGAAEGLTDDSAEAGGVASAVTSPDPDSDAGGDAAVESDATVVAEAVGVTEGADDPDGVPAGSLTSERVTCWLGREDCVEREAVAEGAAVVCRGVALPEPARVGVGSAVVGVGSSAFSACWGFTRGRGLLSSVRLREKDQPSYPPTMAARLPVPYCEKVQDPPLSACQ